MKILSVFMIAAAAYAAVPERTVSVCIHQGSDRPTVHAAEVLASAVFVKIGVNIEWHDRGPCPAREDMIEASVSYNTESKFRPRALGVAKPYQRQIVVFYDRIKESQVDHMICLLAYLLAHEIAHVLQGTGEHSRTGIMKATWSYGDYFDMIRCQLGFTAEDVALIYRGIEAKGFHPPDASRLAVQ